MAKVKFLGRTHMSHMSVGDFCRIKIIRRNVDVLKGPTYEDFNDEWYRGEVSEMGNARLFPQPIRAFFADDRIDGHKNEGVQKLSHKEPPFEYEVRPLYRMQGVTTHGNFHVDDICIIKIGDFDTDPKLLLNDGLPALEILRLFPAESFKGIWRGRVIQVSESMFKTEGVMCHPIAVVFDDPRIVESSQLVKDWCGHEPPVKYQVDPEDVRIKTVILATKGLKFLGKTVKDLRTNLGI
ncbi:TPA: hypothetical protein DCW61_01270 [Candidatus Uhrbacteria bacterium]|nr:hypothetical protein [Candidatus Uhrbacteria bacterium]